MTKIIIAFIIGLPYMVIGQNIPCDYVPLTFDSITPIWSHLSIDSTMIGHVDSCGDWAQNYYDGMDHLNFESGSFVTDQHLYSITMTDYDGDRAGYLIEKIDLQTGEMLWNAISDLRTGDYREWIAHAHERNGKLFIYGRRMPVKDMKGDPIFNFSITTQGVHFHKIYDAESGELLLHYTPEESDTLAFIMDFRNVRINRYYREGYQDQFITAHNLISEELSQSLLRHRVDSLGYLISGPDTVVSGFMNGLPNGSAHLTFVNAQEKTTDGTHLFVEQFSPMDTKLYDFRATLTEYDDDFNVKKSLDLTSILPDEFYLIQLNGDRSNQLDGITDDYIFLLGSYKPLRDFYEYFQLILDRDFNLVSRYDVSSDEGFLSGFLSHPTKTGNVFFSNNNSSTTAMQVHQNNDNGNLSLLKTFSISEPDWVSFIEEIIVLGNGDFLIRMTHSCYVDDEKGSWHPEWMRFAQEDIIGPVSVTETTDKKKNRLTLSPNPVRQNLQVEIKNPIKGMLSVLDISGSSVLSLSIENEVQLQVNVSSLPAGAYILILHDHKGVQFRERFVKLD